MERIRASSVIVTQAGSPVFAPDAFWSVVTTLEVARQPFSDRGNLAVTPYHAYVPSFGDWGFALASGNGAPRWSRPLPDDVRFLTPSLWPAMRTFARDAQRGEVAPNSIRTHQLVRYYEQGWAKWYE